MTVARKVKAFGKWILIELIARLLFYTGIIYLIARVRARFGRTRLLVPMYHHVEPPNANGALLDIERAAGGSEFERHVRIYKWFGPVTTLANGFRMLRQQRPPARTIVAITFDDGYRDVYTVAFPILRQRGCAATVFPVVRVAGGGEPLWWDQIASIVRKASLSERSAVATLSKAFRAIAGEVPAEPTSSEPRPGRVQAGSEDGNGSLQALLEELLRLPDRERRRVTREFARLCGISGSSPIANGTYASWDELAEMAAAGIEIGAHTLHHVALVSEPADIAREQIAACAPIIAQRTGQRPRSFAYPNGCYDGTIANMVKEAGYQCAVTVEHGVNYADSDPMRLKRVPVGSERAFHLAFKLAFYGLVHR
jgi:peptidoglycan/xylan/chitin deacetylase (PgdA/CDA1 family)